MSEMNIAIDRDVSEGYSRPAIIKSLNSQD
jgi:hypothetical protein